ncbi:MAG: HK97 family phage prohead protease [Natronohydrobacter sp.]|nr:HK97 family phage prohead protease [Natronohydrobacter sp.]
MLWGAASGALELRAETGGVRLVGRFPYDSEAELAPGRSERIAARAFAARIEAEDDLYFLSGHDFDKPLASRGAGTLTIRDTGEAVQIEAQLDEGTTWARDFLAAHRSGLIRGLSPGFRVAEGGEQIVRRGNGLLRTITRADLVEISAVTRPAYPAAQIEARAWNPLRDDAERRGLYRTFNRWRP